MGSLKQKMVRLDEWDNQNMTREQFNYIKNVNSFAQQTTQYMEAMQAGFLKLVAIEKGYDPKDDLMFDIDLDINPDLEFRIKKA